MKKSRGFTIVEILIVIAVLGILFTIVSVAWIAIMKQSEDDIRYAEHQEWVQRFETYRNLHGVYPNVDDESIGNALAGPYCLGTGFPNGHCVDGSVPADDNAPNRVMQELAKAGTLPKYRPIAVGDHVGPFAYYGDSDDSENFLDSTEIRVYHIYHGDCPEKTIHDSDLDEGVACYIELQKK